MGTKGPPRQSLVRIRPSRDIPRIIESCRTPRKGKEDAGTERRKDRSHGFVP
jgi:hypothetical protein